MSKVKIQGNASGTGVVTLTAPNTNTDRTITLPDSTGSILMSDGDGSQLTNLPGGGKVLQVVDVHNGSVSTFTASIPFDDTIPQITEGTEIMTLSITPTSTTSKLFIQAGVFATPSANNMIITTCLFEGTTSNALSAIYWRDSLAGFGDIAQLNHTMVSGSTSIKTFRIRMGIDSGSSTTTVNGHGGGRRYGGVISSFIRITEYEV